MTGRRFLFSLMGATAFTLSPMVALSEDKSGENSQPSAVVEAPSAVAQAALAQELFALAKMNRNPLGALAAAQIMLSLDIEEVERDKETKDIDGETVAEEGTGMEAPADAGVMLAFAREMAGGDETLLGLIDDVEAEGTRGRIGGAYRALSRLRAGKIDIFRIPFYGGRLAELAIIGDGDANLDLLVTDEGGNTICYDRSYSDKLYCDWTPRWDGYFYVAVENRGRMRNSYYILTN